MGLQKLASLVKDNLFSSPKPATAEDHKKAIQLATAGLLLEIAYADEALSLDEEHHLTDFLKGRFSLDDDTARNLIEAADELRSETIDHFHFTSVIRRSLSLEERIEIVKTMWRLIYVDGQLHQYENYLVRKLADLLGLEHHVMIEAKLAVQGEK